MKWVGSITSIVSTPGPHLPTWFGSITNAQTRLARGGDVDSTFEMHAVLQGESRGQSGKDTDGGVIPAVPGAARKAAGSLMNRVRQPIEQNA